MVKHEAGYYNPGDNKYVLGMVNLTISQYQRNLELEKQIFNSCQDKSPEEVIEIITSVDFLGEDEGVTSDLFLKRGLAEKELGNFDDAIRDFTNAIYGYDEYGDEQTHHEQIKYFHLAETLVRKGDYANAILPIYGAINGNPKCNTRFDMSGCNKNSIKKLIDDLVSRTLTEVPPKNWEKVFLGSKKKVSSELLEANPDRDYDTIDLLIHFKKEMRALEVAVQIANMAKEGKLEF